MILSEQLSKKIVNIMSDNNIIDSHLDAAYIYCIDFALDLVLFNLSIIIIGALTHNFILSVIYVTVLVPTKMLAGGAHAGSTYACCSISYSVYLLCMLLCRLIPGIPVLNILVCLVTGTISSSTQEQEAKLSSKTQNKKILLLLHRYNLHPFICCVIISFI